MSVSHNSSIVRNGLICYLDPANPASYTPGQNLLTYSEQFNNAAWGKSNCTVTTDAILAPNGTLTADKLVEDATNAEHNLAYSAGSASNVTQTFSVYAKAGERSLIALQLSNYVNAAAQVGFNLANGTVLFTGASNADYTNISARIDVVGGGWYRCSITATKGAVNTISNPVIQPHNGTTTVFASNTSTGFYIWGAQLETSASMGPYVQTVASTAATRSTTWVNLMGNATYNGTINGAVVFNSANTSAPANFQFSSNTTNITVSALDFRTAPHTIIAATRYMSGQQLRVIQSPNNNYVFGHWGGQAEKYYSEGWVTGSGGGPNDTNWRVFACTGHSVSDWWQFYVNGNKVVSNNGGSQGPNGVSWSNGSYSAEWSNAQAGVFLAYNRILTDQEVAQTTAALRGRYGV